MDNSCDERPLLVADHYEIGNVYEEEDDYDEDESDNETDNVADCKFGWVIVFGGFLTQMLNVGLMRTDGIYFLQFRSRFKESAQLCAWPGALSLTVQSFMGPVATALCNRYSVRTTVIIATVFNVMGLVLSGFCTNITQLFVTYGILQGIGRGLAITSSIFIVNMYFEKMRAKAIGLSMTGSGLGTFALVPLNQWLFDMFGFTHAFLIIATMATSGFIMAALFRPFSMHVDMERQKRLKSATNLKDYTQESRSKSSLNPTDFDGLCFKCQHNFYRKHYTENRSACCQTVLKTCFPIEHKERVKKSNGKKREIFHFPLLKDIPFLIMCVCMVFFNLANKTVFSFLPAIGRSKGLTQSEASLLFSALGVGDMAGRFAAGFIMDISCISPQIFYGSVLFLSSITSFAVTFVWGFPMFCAVAACYGVFSGVSISQKPTMLVKILGKEVLTTSFGIVYCFQGLGTISGPPVSGALRDYLGAYDYAFYLTGVCMALSGALYIFSCYLFYMRRRREEALKTCGSKVSLLTSVDVSGYDEVKDNDGTVQVKDNDGNVHVSREQQSSIMAEDGNED